MYRYQYTITHQVPQQDGTVLIKAAAEDSPDITASVVASAAVTDPGTPRSIGDLRALEVKPEPHVKQNTKDQDLQYY